MVMPSDAEILLCTKGSVMYACTTSGMREMLRATSPVAKLMDGQMLLSNCPMATLDFGSGNASRIQGLLASTPRMASGCCRP